MVRFGLTVPTSAAPGSDPARAARRAEELGFELVTVSDHLHGTRPTFETWTLLTWLAAATSRVMLAPLVLGLPYRNPAVTAKMAESLQRLSGRRLILGIGAGGSDEEFAAFGIERRSRAEKVEAFEEALGLMRALWTESAVTRSGRFYRANAAELEPKPEGGIPIWTGSYGPSSLEVTGRLADGWNPSMPYAEPEQIPPMLERIRASAREAGRDASLVTAAYNVPVRLDEHASRGGRALTGGPEEIAERLAQFVRLGFDWLVFWAIGGEEQPERLAGEVLPLVRDALG